MILKWILQLMGSSPRQCKEKNGFHTHTNSLKIALYGHFLMMKQWQKKIGRKEKRANQWKLESVFEVRKCLSKTTVFRTYIMLDQQDKLALSQLGLQG
mmetsp:Transcript_10813/g.15826  ORF Transcript_10813/g.15826 Transcript_10813/m.15826 type:complete len:98 (-) Transcript_10813:99-392(-)